MASFKPFGNPFATLVAWVIERDKDGSPHIIPTHDSHPHRCSAECWCRPVIDGDGLMSHHSADGREAYERGERRPH